MPIEYRDNLAVFEGHSEPEEADALLEWLRRTPEPQADLGACTDLHTALAQLLMVARVRIALPPADQFLAACLTAATAAHGSGAAVYSHSPDGSPQAETFHQ
jgi:hypothetical protein